MPLPPVLYINRDSREDRRRFMEEQFARLGIPARRISAVEAEGLSQADLERYCDRTQVHFLSRSQLACTRSHVRCWQDLLDAGAEWGLVLEDDAVLSPKLRSFLDLFDGTGFDLVQLETITSPVSVLAPVATIGLVRLRPFRTELRGTAGYLIARPAIARLLASPGLFTQPADYALFRPLTRPASELRAVLADPALCIQLNKLDAGGASQGDVKPVRSAPIRTAPLASLRRRLFRIGLGLRALGDEARYLGRAERIAIPFDGPIAPASGPS
ncbi:MAG: glycosyltransferase family 25 protein [Devosia sp.]